MLQKCKEGGEIKWPKTYYKRKVRKARIKECVKAYKQRKAQKAKIKEELLPIAWGHRLVLLRRRKSKTLKKLWKV